MRFCYYFSVGRQGDIKYEARKTVGRNQKQECRASGEQSLAKKGS
jgi:hypothetical protein